MLVSIEGHRNGGQKPTESSVFYKSVHTFFICVNSSLDELIKIEVTIFF